MSGVLRLLSNLAAAAFLVPRPILNFTQLVVRKQLPTLSRLFSYRRRHNLRQLSPSTRKNLRLDLNLLIDRRIFSRKEATKKQNKICAIEAHTPSVAGRFIDRANNDFMFFAHTGWSAKANVSAPKIA